MIGGRQIERPYTAEDLAATPDDGKRYEIIGGELVVSSSQGTEHQRILRRLTMKFYEFLYRTGIGEVFPAPRDVTLSHYNILVPDLIVILDEHEDRITEFGGTGRPDLVIEILSPATASMDRIWKSASYSTFGVAEYWIVDPQTRTILAEQLANGQYQPIESVDGLVRSVRTTGLVIDPAEIFSPQRLQADRGDTAPR